MTDTSTDSTLYVAADDLQAPVNQAVVGQGVYKVTIGIGAQSNLARDVNYVTPHFRDGNSTKNPGALATMVGDATSGWLTGTSKITVNVYDVARPKPNPPLATYVKNPAGGVVSGNSPMELALCLSYYATYNRPRMRGRLYIPLSWIYTTGATGSASPRPIASQWNAVMAFATQVLKSPKGAGYDWIVYSKTANTESQVTNYWVDDEWDIIRSRGQRGTSRVLGTNP